MELIKKLGLLVLLVFFAGCATTGLEQKVTDLEKEVASLKTQVRIALAGGAAGTGTVRWRPALTGTDGLDTIGCASMDEGNAALVPVISGTTASVYVYVWDDDTNASAASPTIIVPTDRTTNCAGLGAWRLASVYAPSFVGNSADLTRYLYVVNSANPTSPSEGWLWYDTGSHRLEYRDNVGVKYISGVTAE